MQRQRFVLMLDIWFCGLTSQDFVAFRNYVHTLASEFCDGVGAEEASASAFKRTIALCQVVQAAP
jgi:hypothetical protein